MIKGDKKFFKNKKRIIMLTTSENWYCMCTEIQTIKKWSVKKRSIGEQLRSLKKVMLKNYERR